MRRALAILRPAGGRGGRILAATLIGGSALLAGSTAAAMLLDGIGPAAHLRGIAAVLFGDGGGGGSGAALGLAVHYAATALFSAGALAVLERPPLNGIAAWKGALLAGLAAYCLVHGIILPMRLGSAFPNPDKLRLALDLAPWLLGLGAPLAWLARGAAVQPSAADLRSR